MSLHNAERTKVAYRPEIDGLRAIAVIAVMLFHARLGLPGGYVGVDVFFVISGYLITQILMHDADAKPRPLMHFYARRIRRIAPALTVVLIASTLASLFAAQTGPTEAHGESLIASLFFVANLYFRNATGNYFAAPVDSMPLLHLWSLSVEEQFYLVFPFAMLLIFRRWRGALLWLLIAAVCISLALAQILVVIKPWQSFYLSPARGWEFAAGALVAELERRCGTGLGIGSRVSAVLSLAGLAALIAPMFLYSDATVFPGIAAVPVVAGTALVIALARRGNPAATLLAMRPLVLVGLLSYSAYLWHQPLLAWARILSVNHVGAAKSTALLALTFVLAAPTWRFIEQPFRDPGRMTFKRVLAILIPCQLLLLAAGLASWLGQGLPQRLSAYQRGLITLHGRNSAARRSICHYAQSRESTFDNACPLGSPNGTNTLAILGDSHAIAISPAFDRALAGRGARGIVLAMPACMPMLPAEGETPSECTGFQRAALDHIIASRSIATVVLAARWTIAFEQSRFDNGEGGIETGALAQWAYTTPQSAAAGVARMVRAIRAAGKRVILVYPVPEAGWDVPLMLAKLGPPWRRKATSTSRARFDDRNRATYRILDSMGQEPGITRVYPAAGLCDATRCALEAGRYPLYVDSNHLTAAGAHRALPGIAHVLDQDPGPNTATSPDYRRLRR